jgi:hypothetical protein
VAKEEVEVWLSKNIPVIRDWILNQDSLRHRTLIFEMWSTGGFTEEALTLLEHRKKTTTKHQIDFYNLDEMVEKSKEINSKKFTEILREYYVKEL